MAGVRRSSGWAAAALLWVAWAAMASQAQLVETGALVGRLTDVHSTPLSGATVVLRNEATGAEARTTTGKNGNYRFAGLTAGAYTLEAESAQGRGRLDGIFVAAGHEARVQAAMEFEPAPERTIQDKNQAIETLRALGHAADEGLRVVVVRLEATAVGEPLPLRGLAMSARALPAVAKPEVSISPVPALMVSALHSGGKDLSVETLRVGTALELEPLVGLPLVEVDFASAGNRNDVVGVERVDPVAPTVTTTVTAEQLQALPISGRRWQDFVLDAPAAGETGHGALRGAGQGGADTTLDGASTWTVFGGAGSGSGQVQGRGDDQNAMSQAWAGGRGSIVAEAAIRTVEMDAGSAEAESTRGAGGRMGVVTESGESRGGASGLGRGLHGQAFVFDRQNTWGARNPFTQWVKETTAGSDTTTPVFTAKPYTPPDHEMVFAAGVGGEIRRDRLFWFAAVDGYRRNDPGVATVKYPAEFFAQPSNDQMLVLCARLGLSAPGSPGQPSQCPTATVVADYSEMLETLDGLLGPAPRTAAQWVGFGRIDWKAAERHRLTLEGIGATWDSPGGGLTRVSESYGANSFGTSKAGEEWLLGRWEAFLTPNLLAVSQGSMGREILSTHSETPSAFEQTFLRPNLWGQLPQINVDSRYGFSIGNPARFGQGSYPDERLYEGQESIDWVKGSLLVKAGFDLMHNSDATSLLRNQTGTYSYSSVENFASDALVYGAFGSSNVLNPDNQQNCDQTGKVWRDTTGGLHGLGSLPCYSYFSQVVGPSEWNLSTNDWAGYATAQWQAKRLVVFSAGLRWEREQMPPPLALVNNPELAQTQRLPSLGNDWGPRISMAVGDAEGHWPVLRVGYGMYFGRTQNDTIEKALTQTGSLNGDLNFFIRPTDGLSTRAATSNAPPFPCVLPVSAGCEWLGSPTSIVKPGAVEFAEGFRNPEVHQAVVALEERVPGHVEVTASAMLSLGRRLPVPMDANVAVPTAEQTVTYNVCDETPTDPGNSQCGHTGLGPIKATQITVPFYASWPAGDCADGAQLNASGQCGWINQDYQQVGRITSKANSTYEAGMVKLVRYGRRGLSVRAHYTYSHAADWNPNQSPLNPGIGGGEGDFREEYGTSDQDMRHSAAAMVIYTVPWKLKGGVGRVANGWMVSGIGQFRSGLPYTMRAGGALAEEFTTSGMPIVGLGPGMNGSGGDNRIFGVGRNTYRYPAMWKADLRLGKSFDLGAMRKLELLVESFNLFNHQNVTELETTGYSIESGSPPTALGMPAGLPSLNFLTGLKTNTTAFGQPLNVNATNFYRERQVQVGMRMRF
jgi:Carboxypeptidase regulatory-like domain